MTGKRKIMIVLCFFSVLFLFCVFLVLSRAEVSKERDDFVVDDLIPIGVKPVSGHLFVETEIVSAQEFLNASPDFVVVKIPGNGEEIMTFWGVGPGKNILKYQRNIFAEYPHYSKRNDYTLEHGKVILTMGVDVNEIGRVLFVGAFLFFVVCLVIVVVIGIVEWNRDSIPED